MSQSEHFIECVQIRLCEVSGFGIQIKTKWHGRVASVVFLECGIIAMFAKPCVEPVNDTESKIGKMQNKRKSRHTYTHHKYIHIHTRKHTEHTILCC